MIRSLTYLLVGLSPAIASAGELAWQRVQLDATFRSEGVAAADFNKDGRLDVLAGDVWYEAPDWTMHELRPAGTYKVEGGYSQSFANWAHDVNGDGWSDALIVGFPGAPCHWYENPQGNKGHWEEHTIWHSACNESPDFVDLTGDGTPELLLGSQPEKQMGYLPVPAAQEVRDKWTFHPISRPGNPKTNGSFKYYHGLGTGDVNNDGRRDVLIPHGWWEAPKNRSAKPWTFHPLKLAQADGGSPIRAADMFVDDLDRDGDNDILLSSAHNYGIWWFENTAGNEQPRFTPHLIDDSYSQTHALAYVDLNGDGQRDLVTGKRFFAHNGHDPGGKEPVVMSWYEVHCETQHPPQFIPHEIVAGRGTGVGTQFEVTDMDQNGNPDVLLSNKKGVNLLLSRPK